MAAKKREPVADPSAITHRLARQVADWYGYPVADLVGAPRYQRIAEARHVLCYLGKLHGMSSVELGHQLGRDHTTILYSWSVVAKSPRLLRLCCELAAAYRGAA